MLTSATFDCAGWLPVPPVSWPQICKLGYVSGFFLQRACCICRCQQLEGSCRWSAYYFYMADSCATRSNRAVSLHDPTVALSSCSSVLTGVTAGQCCPSFSWSRQHFQLWLILLLILKSVGVMAEVTDAGLKFWWGFIAAIDTRRGARGLNQVLNTAVLLALFWRMDLCQRCFLQMPRDCTTLLGSGRMMETRSPLCCPVCAAVDVQQALRCTRAPPPLADLAPSHQKSCFGRQRRDMAGHPRDQKVFYRAE